MRSLLKRFADAGRGVIQCAREEANMRIHVGMTAAVVVLGGFLRINMTQWLVVIACCGAVMSLECVNSAIERLADRVTTDPDPLIGQAKDFSAAAVLVAAITAAIMGLMIFAPKLVKLFGF